MDHKRNRQINLLKRGQLFLYRSPNGTPIIYRFIYSGNFVRSKPRTFYAEDVFGIVHGGETVPIDLSTMKSDRIQFISRYDQIYKTVEVLYSNPKPNLNGL